jgi:hypothetical protein
MTCLTVPHGIGNAISPERKHRRPFAYPIAFAIAFGPDYHDYDLYGVGRGCGAGRGRGVTLGVALGVAVGVVIGVAVAVGVGLGPRVAENFHRSHRDAGNVIAPANPMWKVPLVSTRKLRRAVVDGSPVDQEFASRFIRL